MDKQAVHQLIRERRSFYPAQLTGEPISDDVINEWLHNAIWAPTHKLTQPWHFIIYSGNSLKGWYEHIAKLHEQKIDNEIKRKKKLVKLQLMEEKVSHVVFIIMNRSTEIEIPEVEEIAAVSCAAQNLYLSMKAYGIGGYWSTGNYSLQPEMHAFLQLKDYQRCLGFFVLGTPKNIDIPAQREPIENKIEWHH